ncbi:MAG: histidinol dehydrogenase [Spirochaetes bacterium]|uniref:Histidinol dehydrogenase n=1 Tax=Candidatus Ornithospirochaeta stercoripullorum TaxID=2840899 RepID=A0A9D9DYP5_9SPIO|nr:histidinol dehydrogenase [Candidatus Ornithospirochaeta stercoripullorum]
MYISFTDFDRRLLARPCEEDREKEEAVRKIIADVKARGDAALFDYAERFDGGAPSSLYVTDEEFAEAENLVPSELKAAIWRAMKNIKAFHEAQMPKSECVETERGVRCWRKIVPISRVGLYVPGGTAPLFSTVLMLAVPASVAKCKMITLATPAKNGAVSPVILYAAKTAGVDNVLKIGGAQAIAALSYGTESVPKCDKIFGPGNSFVTEAKRQISQHTAIDMIAGPSEVMVCVDRTSVPAFAAADLLSQAEHGKDSQAMLVIKAENREEAYSIYKKVDEAVGAELERIGRHEYMLPSLSHSFAFPAYSDEEMLDIINGYAPEHLIISTEHPDKILQGVENAGSVFLGGFTPESAGDYASGTNHTLPTSGWAVSSSGVSLDSFLKKITVQEISKEGLSSLGETIECMAEAEGLEAHSYAVKVRLNDD